MTFDFKKWLLDNGWSNIHADCYTKPNKHEKDTFFRILLFATSNRMELAIFDNNFRLLQDNIKDGCLIPSNEQEAQVFTKLFEL